MLSRTDERHSNQFIRKPSPASKGSVSTRGMYRLYVPELNAYIYRATKQEAKDEAARVVSKSINRDGTLLTTAEIESQKRSSARGAAAANLRTKL